MKINKLFVDIKLAAAAQEDTQIRQNYKRVFDVCTEKYIGELAGQDILKLLKDNDEISIDNHFNSIRKVIEDLFIAFNKFDLIPAEFVTPNVALNESSRFLVGKSSDGSLSIEKGYQHLEDTHLPKQIAYYFRAIVPVTQAGSHRSDIDIHVKTIKTPFLFKSILYQLLDVLVWFKMYVDTKPKTGNWLKAQTITEANVPKPELNHGKVININTQKGFAFFKPDVVGENIFIPPHLVTNHNLNDGMSVHVEIEEYNDNRNNDLKIRVKRVEISS